MAKDTEFKPSRNMQGAKLRQIMGQTKARMIVDKQYFQQRRAERLAVAFDDTECEANAPRFVPA